MQAMYKASNELGSRSAAVQKPMASAGEGPKGRRLQALSVALVLMLVVPIMGLESASNPTVAEAATMQRYGNDYVFWLTRAETRTMRWAPRAALRVLPAGYRALATPYAYAMSRSAKSYVRARRCMMIQFRSYGYWAHPLPVWTSYSGSYCR